MGLFGKLRDMFFPGEGGKKPEKSSEPREPRKTREKRKVQPSKVREEYMDDHSDGQQYEERISRLSHGRDMMSPEVVKSFNEFSQLLHNINIKMASQNDQNMALLQSLESLPSIIKDIPRARELEGDILQEIHLLLKSTHDDKLKLADRLLDIKSAMMAMEENSKAQISFFEGKERGHRDQMNMMREFIEREKKHHRNNLTGIVFIVILFIGLLCAGAFLFVREKFNTLEQSINVKLKEAEADLRTRERESRPARSYPESRVEPLYSPPRAEAPVYRTETEVPKGVEKGEPDSASKPSGDSVHADGAGSSTEKPVVPFE